jgi:hypothetical protein
MTDPPEQNKQHVTAFYTPGTARLSRIAAVIVSNQEGPSSRRGALLY